MKRKLLVVSVLFIMIMSTVLTACGGEKEASEPIVIKFSHEVDENSPKGKAANLFRDLVSKRLGDKVKVEVYPNSQLYDDFSGLEALQAGNIQMMAPSSSKLVGLNKSFQIFEMPFLFKDNEQVFKFTKSETGKKLFKKTEPYNITVLDLWLGGFKQFTNNKRQLKTPKDFKGLKFRVMSGGILEDQFKALGASATVIPFSETYVALQQGTIDGQENPFNNIETQKFHEVQNNMTISNHAPATYPLIVNTDFWNSLPKDIRTELEKITKEVTRKEIEWTDDLNQNSLNVIKERDVKIYKLTNKQRQEFIKAMEPVYKKYEDVIGKEFIEKARSFE